MKYDIGIIGLGVMGRNFLLNLADHGFAVAGYDNDTEKTEKLNHENSNENLYYTSSLKEFLDGLRQPRSVILLVPAGPIVDKVIDTLEPLLEKGDLIVDMGNSYYKDTDLRENKLSLSGILFIGAGISGGEYGARFGASIMPGGRRESYERIRPFFEAAAARAGDSLCVRWLGPHSSGHFVKMVHNGIEYGLMQLIAESYALLKLYLNMSDDQLAYVFRKWNETDLNSYLIGITSEIFTRVDDKTGRRLVDMILDVSRQKGTGMWTSQSAMELHTPVPSIDVSVSLRNLSARSDERLTASALFSSETITFTGTEDDYVHDLQSALYVTFLIVYAQGFSLLKAASEEYKFNLDPIDISNIWRGGCIIRSSMLEEINNAFLSDPNLTNLLFDPQISRNIIAGIESLRKIVISAVSAGIAVPAIASSLSYFDSYRSKWLPANLIQAQRDYFGGHTYERNDTKGTYHTEWIKILKDES